MTEQRDVALVTGGARRIGRAIVSRLAAAGYDVVIHCNASVAEGEKLAEAIRLSGGRAVVVAADLSDAEGVAGLGEAAGAFFGPVTLLVNNASLFLSDTAATLEPEQWDRQFAVNLRAPVLLAGLIARALPEDRGGAIVNLLDQRVWKLTPEHFSYTLTKSALWTATRTLAQGLAPRLRVNAVGPGPTLPNAYEGEARFQAEAAETLLARPVPPEAIAEAVLFLARAEHITGQMLAVDSGQHLGWKTPDVLVR